MTRERQLSTYERWYGRDEPPPEIIPLRAGKINAEFQNGDLRHLCYGDQELIQRVYMAVRDHNWNTIPGTISDLKVEMGEDSFKITYQCRHQQGPIDFRWQARLEGSPNGTVAFALDGTAGSAFRYDRIGFCVLHPIPGIAGQPYQAVTPGGMVSGRLPLQVAPQYIEDGFETPMFPSCSSLSITLEDGIKLVTDFEGDLFEMEDQRNWTDGSFKTYCTPISLGYPYQAKPGQTFFQKVTIHLEAPGLLESKAAPAREGPIRVALNGETGRRLPKLGFGIPEEIPGERENRLVARLRPDHLKLELHLQDADWPERLNSATQVSLQVGSPLELTLFLPDDPAGALEQLASRLEGVDLARVIVFNEEEAAQTATSTRWMKLARQALSEGRPGLPFIGGTNGNFAEINREPPDMKAMDGIAYTLNPQVHASDERSLIEALLGQRDSAISAAAISGGAPVTVSSVTLKPPFNQAATEEEGPDDPNQLPGSVDQRQMSLFAAAWTVGSLHALAEGGVGSVTYFEMSGWRGLVETGKGSRLPEQFLSFSGMVFPVYWVFAFLSDAKGARVFDSSSERPLLADVLFLRKEDQAWLLVANYLPKNQVIVLSPLPGKAKSRLRLNEDSFMTAAAAPEAFLASAEGIESSGELILHLKPYETSMIDIRL